MGSRDASQEQDIINTKTITTGNTSSPIEYDYQKSDSRTKRKRDNSSPGGRSESPGMNDLLDGKGPSLPPWSDPDYPYSKGVIG